MRIPDRTPTTWMEAMIGTNSQEPVRVLVMGCIGQTDARVRSGGAGDTVRIGKP